MLSLIKHHHHHHPLTLTRVLIFFNNTTSNTLSHPKCHYPFPHPSQPFPTNFCSTTTSDQQSFTLSYLKEKCGFSQQAALKVHKHVTFITPQKPDSVIAYFRTLGLSDSQIRSVISRIPKLLLCDPNKRLLPKFQFLASKGASPSDIILMVCRSPTFLNNSLKNHIVPAYEFVRQFFHSDEKTIARIISFPLSISEPRIQQNVNLLINEGLSNSNILHVFRTRPSVLCSSDLISGVQEVKQLGFNPSKISFSVALLAKRALTKSQWEAKFKALEKWGWSEQEFLDAFMRHPLFMLLSKEKLDAVMSLWVEKLGWDRSALCMRPLIFGYSLEKRLIPRALVVKHLLSKGLMKKNASICTPFSLSEDMFMKKYVMCFDEKEASQILKLYQGAFSK